MSNIANKVYTIEKLDRLCSHDKIIYDSNNDYHNIDNIIDLILNGFQLTFSAIEKVDGTLIIIGDINTFNSLRSFLIGKVKYQNKYTLDMLPPLKYNILLESEVHLSIISYDNPLTNKILLLDNLCQLTNVDDETKSKIMEILNS